MERSPAAYTNALPIFVKIAAVKPMAELVKGYNFGFPLQNVQQLDAIEQNILTDDKYASSLVKLLS